MGVDKKVFHGLISKAEADKVNNSFSENALKMMKKRYLQKDEKGYQETPAEMFHRIAHALAEVEAKYNHDKKFIEKVERDFFDMLAGKEYTPGGRTITNAGASTPVVPNCVVLPIEDSMESIFQTLKEAALLQQAGCGLGFDFSQLRPAMTPTKKSNGVASGPVSFLKVYNEAFGIIKQQGRHGANMAMMQIDHPDVLDFIRAKEREGEIRNFNISIKVTDEFMNLLVKKPDAKWMCEWRGQKMKPRKVLRTPSGSVTGIEEMDLTVKQIFDELVNYAWLNGEPGIVFIDEINRTNPLPGLGPIRTSNPCGEQFLHAYDNCNLGSINLSVFVKNGKVDWDHLKEIVRRSVRFGDNVIDIFDFPVKQLGDMANGNRRIGLGIMGFADMLYKMGLAYNSKEGLAMGEKVMKFINDNAHQMSKELAKEKGEFPNTDKSVFAKAKFKMRNAALTTVAPTGSISMMFDCSSGIEPNFALSFIKQDKDGLQYNYFNQILEEALKKSKLPKEKVAEIKEALIKTGSIQGVKGVPDSLKKVFVVSMDISADDHLKMQAAFQRNVDNSISKTINFPNSATKEDVFNGYVSAWKLKCKSTTVYRDGSRNVQVLNIGTADNVKSIKDFGKADNATEAQSIATIDQNRVEPKKRPDVMTGRTYRIKTGYGKLYITVNDDENGAPFEVFATIGKNGGFFQEQSEGICRMISLSLRAGVKVEDIIDNMKGIRGPMPMLTSKGTILSLPDAIGHILEEHVKLNAENPKKVQAEEKPRLEDKKNEIIEEITVTQKETATVIKAKAIADYGMMPGCPECGGTLKLQEGCMSCVSCGFSRCG